MNTTEIEKEIDYWLLINNNIDEKLKNLEGVILVLHNSLELSQCIDFFNKIKSNHFTRVLYISLTRSYNYMRHVLEKKPINQKQLFFIDVVSGFAFPPEENIDNCLYHRPPRDLKTIKEIISFGIERTNPDIIIIDSLSQLINYSKLTGEELKEFYSFLHDIKHQMLNIINNTFILMFDTNMQSAFHPLVYPGFDLILKLERKNQINHQLSCRERYPFSIL